MDDITTVGDVTLSVQQKMMHDSDKDNKGKLQNISKNTLSLNWQPMIMLI